MAVDRGRNNIWHSDKNFFSQREIREFDDWDNFEDYFGEDAFTFGESEYGET